MVELEILNEEKTKEITEKKNIDIGNENSVSLKDILYNYAASQKILGYHLHLLKKNLINLN